MIDFRSNCPLARSLDVFGDKWTLLVLREIVAFKKHTFKEISQMEEGIATNTLSDRLEKLCKNEFLTRRNSDFHKSVYLYEPTQKAIELFPILLELRKWSVKFLFKENEIPNGLS